MDDEQRLVWIIFYTTDNGRPLLCGVFQSEKGADDALLDYDIFLEEQRLPGYYWIGIEELKP